MIGGKRLGIAVLCGLLGSFPGLAQEPGAVQEPGTSHEPGSSVEPESPPRDASRWNGFFQVREQFPLTAGYLVIEPISGFTLPAGTWEVDLSVSQSNTFTASQLIERSLDARTRRGAFDRQMFDAYAAMDPRDQSHYLDAQVGRLAFRGRRGLPGGFEIDLLVPLLQVHGGNTDRLVEAFHDLTQLDQEGRKGVYRDRMSLFVSGQGFDLDIEASSQADLGDVVLGVKKRVLGDGLTRSLLVGLDLKLPTGDEAELVGSGAVDVGLSLVGSRCWRTSCLHAMAGMVFAGKSEVLPTDSQAVFTSSVGFEQGWRKGWGMTIQMQYWQSYLEDLGFYHFSQDTIQSAATVSRMVGGAGRFYLGLSENSFSFKNSADVTFHLGWRKRFE